MEVRVIFSRSSQCGQHDRVKHDACDENANHQYHNGRGGFGVSLVECRPFPGGKKVKSVNFAFRMSRGGHGGVLFSDFQSTQAIIEKIVDRGSWTVDRGSWAWIGLAFGRYLRLDTVLII